ncbi:MAG: type III polyketide synthase [Planctomycetes bacterium]|nr:type III polyketide synthase [Planctomycetota bacterium]
MDVVIAGFGTALPGHPILQAEAGKVAVDFCCELPEQARSVEALYRAAGVESRHSVVLNDSQGSAVDRQSFYPPRSPASLHGPSTGQRMQYFEQAAGPLAISAAAQALLHSGVDSRRISHLVTVSCSGFSAPGFDLTLIEQLPLRPTVGRTQVGFMGCHAALNGLRVARAFVAADPSAVVLVCCVELCTLHYQYGWDPEQIVANSLFADGAAACVVQSADADHGDASPPYRILASGSVILPDSRDAMTWRVGDHGFRMTLSPSVPVLLSTHLSPWLTEWLGAHDQSPASIRTWAVHPGGPRILRGFAEAINVAQDQLQVSREILRRHGNMSSPTLLFILNELAQHQAPTPCVAIGFGPGLAAEATLLG